MAYDEQLAHRMEQALAGIPEMTEKKMFGGLAFMLNGHMCCGIVGQDLMARVGADRYEAALAKPHARPMDFAGRPMVGMVYVAPEGCRTNDALRSWLDETITFARSLPPKKAKAAAPKRAKSSK